jgi:ABC-type lipoprotein release transport system permease subunit
MTVMLLKLAFAGIRSRLLASALTVTIAGAAAATIVLGLEVRSTSVDPWQRTFAAANGAHVLALVPSRADAAAIARLPGVTERSEPVPLVSATLVSARGSDPIQLAGSTGAARVNQPVPTAGTTPGQKGIVLERSLAEALGIPVGTRVDVRARATTDVHADLEPDGASLRLPVLGTAISPAQARYPRSTPGLAWASERVLERIQPDRGRWHWMQAVRLDDPSNATSFAAHAATGLPAGAASFETWESQRDSTLLDAQPIQLIVTTFAILLLIVAFFVVAILVGARASQQRRVIGLLKAAGLTPRQVGAVFGLESAALSLLATALGFALGITLAPRLAAPSADTLLGSPTIAPNPWHLLIASCVVLPVLLAGALTSSRRSARYTVVQAIRSADASPPRTLLVRAVIRPFLPVALALGLKDTLARGRRALLLTGTIALTDAVVVVALSLEATLDARPAGEVSDVPNELPVLVYTLDAVLLVITLTTLVAVALLSVRERVRDYGILKAIGLTPAQITSTVIGANAALALLAALLSIPLGIGLYLALYQATSGNMTDAVVAPWPWLALIPIATLLLVVAATGLPARLATRIRAAEALRFD